MTELEAKQGGYKAGEFVKFVSGNKTNKWVITGVKKGVVDTCDLMLVDGNYKDPVSKEVLGIGFKLKKIDMKKLKKVAISGWE